MNANARVMSVSLVVSMMAFNMTSYAQGTTPARKPIAERDIRFPDYFGTYAVLPNGETVLLDNPVNVATYDVPRRSLPYDVEFIVYGKNVDPSGIQLLSVPASRPRGKKQSEMQRLMDVNAMEEQMMESSGIPRGSKAGKLFVKPVSNQPQMFRLIPAGTLPGGVYQIGNSDDKWYRFVVGNTSGQRAAQSGSTLRPADNEGSSVESASVQTPEKARNIAEVEKAKAVLTLPASCGIAGAMDADENTVITSGEGLRNLLKALRIESLSELAVNGEVINVGDRNTRAYYSTAPVADVSPASANKATGQTQKNSGTQSSAENTVRAKLMSSTVQEPYGLKFLNQVCFKTQFTMSGMPHKNMPASENAFYTLRDWRGVQQRKGTIRSSGTDFLDPIHLEWFRMEGQKESLKLDVYIKQEAEAGAIGVTVQVSGRGGKSPSQEQAVDEAVAVCNALSVHGGKLQ